MAFTDIHMWLRQWRNGHFKVWPARELVSGRGKGPRALQVGKNAHFCLPMVGGLNSFASEKVKNERRVDYRDKLALQTPDSRGYRVQVDLFLVLIIFPLPVVTPQSSGNVGTCWGA